MATKIVTKNSSTASAVPTASDLVQGELAVNVADKRLFTEDNGGSIVELGVNPSTIDINAGSIDGTAIGASSASTGAFTTLTATGAFTSRGIDDNADATAITIDSSENVGIGNSSPAGYGKFVVQGTGNLINANASSGAAAFQLYEGGQGRFAIETLNGSAGAKFLLAGTERMRIDSSGNLLVGTTSPVNSAKMSINGNATTFVIHPAVDNLFDCGHPSYRWDDIRATNGTIQTSDRNDKQDIEVMSDAEQRVAVAAKGLLRKFRWKDSVAAKGDDARIHFGIIAQDLQAAFVAEGLDAGDYAMFISDTWTDEETNEEKTRMGVRYSELLAFIIAAI